MRAPAARAAARERRYQEVFQVQFIVKFPYDEGAVNVPNHAA
jgi:hypothetical protein